MRSPERMAALRFGGVRVLSSIAWALLAMMAFLPGENTAVSRERTLTVDDFLKLSSVGAIFSVRHSRGLRRRGHGHLARQRVRNSYGEIRLRRTEEAILTP